MLRIFIFVSYRILKGNSNYDYLEIIRKTLCNYFIDFVINKVTVFLNTSSFVINLFYFFS